MIAESIPKLAQRILRKGVAETFRFRMPRELWTEHGAWIATCKGLSQFMPSPGANGGPVFELAQTLRQETLGLYKNRYEKYPNLRVLIHVPPARVSMGGNSLFQNWVEGLKHMGVHCAMIENGTSVNDTIERFKPTVLFTSDNHSYSRWIDWARLQTFRSRYPMTVAMTAAVEFDGVESILTRLKIARERDIDFFVSFREPEYNAEYLKDWIREGFDVLSIPFSANPVSQFHVPFDPKPLDYVFLASINSEKALRYWKYYVNLLPKYRGIINGPGWRQDELILDRKYHSFLYALGSIGINLHIPVSIDLPTEINERTFILACTGTFQLCDAPMVLRRFFPETAVPSASTPAEYAEQFKYYLENPEKRVSCQLESLRSVYNGHTIFHRMIKFLDRVLASNLANESMQN